MKRMMKADEILGLIFYLSSDASSYSTGQILVEGGDSLVKNIVSIVQARCNSKRLPNKVLRLICKPLIQHIFERIKFCSYNIKSILATTNSEKDDNLIKWAKKK